MVRLLVVGGSRIRTSSFRSLLYHYWLAETGECCIAFGPYIIMYGWWEESARLVVHRPGKFAELHVVAHQ